MILLKENLSVGYCFIREEELCIRSRIDQRPGEGGHLRLLRPLPNADLQQVAQWRAQQRLRRGGLRGDGGLGGLERRGLPHHHALHVRVRQGARVSGQPAS